VLKFAVTLTERAALAQAKQADAEIAAGKYRGPLTACRGAPRTCSRRRAFEQRGRRRIESQMIDEDATL